MGSCLDRGVHFSYGGPFAKPGAFPTPLHTDFPLDDDAKRHNEYGPPLLQRYLPFWAATWIDRTKIMLLPLVALLLPLIKILPPVYRWRVRRRIYRWYVQLRLIDLEIETGAAIGAKAQALGERLAEIESESAQIDIPLSYSDQLYDLRLHIHLLVQKLERITTSFRPPNRRFRIDDRLDSHESSAQSLG